MTSSFHNVCWLNSASYYFFYKLESGRHFNRPQKNKTIWNWGYLRKFMVSVHLGHKSYQQWRIFLPLTSHVAKVMLPLKLFENLSIQIISSVGASTNCWTVSHQPVMDQAHREKKISTEKIISTLLLHGRSSNYAVRQCQVCQITPPFPQRQSLVAWTISGHCWKTLK